jgi:hypothetical protein
LARAQGYISAWLTLEERVIKRGGETKRFMVPALEVDITPAQIMAGNGGIAAVEAAAPVAALPAASATVDMDSWLTAVTAATNVDDLRHLWTVARDGGLVAADIEPILKRRADELTAGPTADPDELWQRILRTVPADWTTPMVEADFEAQIGVDVGSATAVELARYLAGLEVPRVDADHA